MSFLDTYVKKYRLDKLGAKTKKNLDKIEKKLDARTKKATGKLSFEEAIKDHANVIADLIERVSKHFGGWKLSYKNALSSFRFVISIATEVYQIVEQIKSSIVSPGMNKQEADTAKMEFGKDLVWFVWMTVGPLDKTLTWVPFKRTIERKLVRWIAGMGLDAAMDLFQTNKEITSFAVNNTVEHTKAL